MQSGNHPAHLLQWIPLYTSLFHRCFHPVLLQSNSYLLAQIWFELSKSEVVQCPFRKSRHFLLDPITTHSQTCSAHNQISRATIKRSHQLIYCKIRSLSLIIRWERFPEQAPTENVLLNCTDWSASIFICLWGYQPSDSLSLSKLHFALSYIISSCTLRLFHTW